MKETLLPVGTRYHGLLDEFQREVDELMNRFFGTPAEEEAGWYTPDANLVETADAYDVWVDLPGVRSEDLNVELKRGELWITGERKDERTEQEGRTWHRMESRFGKFRRVVRFEEPVDADHIEAEYKDGVLHVRVPKAEQAKTRKIELKTA